ncbi:Hypothetical predicted protein [Mytilus galloprovincialis]|uniref:Uncharacterized protein n=1 Tax=Mytilus galloprovincialis TaxID=29158 RepID=A0A8B6D9Y0_MYTGA|nr:Hypothetical predicted protein [Mytilus galloprovincialis]
MPGLSAGLATFASCDKAGSIPHFTRHLQSHPNDFDALLWRARAYSITRQKEKALADIRRAATYGVGPQKYIAESMCASLEGNGQKSMETLLNGVKAYPKCGEVWSCIGSNQFYSKAHDAALPTLTQAIDLGRQNSETQRPWCYWSNQHVGDIYYEKRQVPNAEPHYNTAVTSCDTFTIAHLGLSRCNIINKNIPEATTRFDRAKELNPILVQWGNFAEFKQDVVSDFYKSDTSAGKRYHGEATSAVESQFSKVTISEKNVASGYSASNRGVSGRQGGGGNNGGGNRDGGGGNGGGNGGGDDDEYVWKKFRKTSKITKKHDDGRQFKRVGSSKYWLSRDKAGHAGSFFKVFIEKGNTLDFIGSVPIRIFHTKVIMDESYLSRILHEGPELEDFNLIPKLESHKGEQIKMKDLHGV